MYLASSIYVLKHIENNKQFGKTIKQQLKRININNKDGNRRWFANRETVTINLWMVKSYVEFLELVSHEMWHVVDLGMIRWFSDQKDWNYTEFWKKFLKLTILLLNFTNYLGKVKNQKRKFCKRRFL